MINQIKGLKRKHRKIIFVCIIVSTKSSCTIKQLKRRAQLAVIGTMSLLLVHRSGSIKLYASMDNLRGLKILDPIYDGWIISTTRDISCSIFLQDEAEITVKSEFNFKKMIFNFPYIILKIFSRSMHRIRPRKKLDNPINERWINLHEKPISQSNSSIRSKRTVL